MNCHRFTFIRPALTALTIPVLLAACSADSSSLAEAESMDATKSFLMVEKPATAGGQRLRTQAIGTTPSTATASVTDDELDVASRIVPGRNSHELTVDQLSVREASRRLCAEYTTSDGRFYAKNFRADQRAEAEQWVRLDPQLSGAAINEGNCVEVNKAMHCPTTREPVCGTPAATDVTSTYSNSCHFEKEVREFAGVDGESKGRHTDGACSSICAEYATSDGRFYAKNFRADQYVEAEQWVRLDPKLSGAAINVGNCVEVNEAMQCPRTWEPVCGTPVATDVASTYSNSCRFEKAVRDFAGVDGESKGHYTDGRCPRLCATALPDSP